MDLRGVCWSPEWGCPSLCLGCDLHVQLVQGNLCVKLVQGNLCVIFVYLASCFFVNLIILKGVFEDILLFLITITTIIITTMIFKDIFVRICLSFLGLLRPWLLKATNHAEVKSNAESTEFNQETPPELGRPISISKINTTRCFGPRKPCQIISAHL